MRVARDGLDVPREVCRVPGEACGVAARDAPVEKGVVKVGIPEESGEREEEVCCKEDETVYMLAECLLHD